MKPTKPKETQKRLRLNKEKVKVLQSEKLDHIVGGFFKPCWDSYTH